MFRTLIHQSSGACDFSIVSPHWLCSCFDVCWSFGVAGWGGIRVASRSFSLPHGYHPTSYTETPTHIETRTHNKCGDKIEKPQAPVDGCINVRNMLSTEEVK